jgi:hypothetical protein
MTTPSTIEQGIPRNHLMDLFNKWRGPRILGKHNLSFRELSTESLDRQ